MLIISYFGRIGNFVNKNKGMEEKCCNLWLYQQIGWLPSSTAT